MAEVTGTAEMRAFGSEEDSGYGSPKCPSEKTTRKSYILRNHQGNIKSRLRSKRRKSKDLPGVSSKRRKKKSSDELYDLGVKKSKTMSDIHRSKKLLKGEEQIPEKLYNIRLRGRGHNVVSKEQPSFPRLLQKEDVLKPYYELEGLLRKGAYGSEVYFCKKLPRGKKFAAKVIAPPFYSDISKDALKVLSVEKDMSIVQYFEKFQMEESVVMIMELCEGNVDQFIQCKKYKRESKDKMYKAIRPIDQHKGAFLDVKFLEYFDISAIEIIRQTVEGFMYLHSYKPAIVHGDIKPSNFLLYKHEVHGTIVKVADFGFSRAPHSESTAAGTPSFMAPEYCVEPGKKVTKTTQADIFSLGLTLFYIFTEGSHVYGDSPTEQLSRIRTRQKPAFNSGLPGGCEMEGVTDEHRITFCDMIRRMLVHEPSQRFNIQDVAKHPTFWNSKKKIDFYRDVNNIQKIAAIQQEKFESTTLDKYERNLMNDELSGEDEIPINRENIPEALTTNLKLELKSVIDLLKLMRSKTWDGGLTAEEKDELGIRRKDTKEWEFDWDKVLRAFTGKVPQLLVHLYEKLRKRFMPEKAMYYHIS